MLASDDFLTTAANVFISFYATDQALAWTKYNTTMNSNDNNNNQTNEEEKEKNAHI